VPDRGRGARVRHPIFARVYERIAAGAERAGTAEHRQRLLAGLAGRVVEVGAGTGLNFRHYPEAVAEVIAVEPEAYLREASRAAAVEHGRVRVVEGTADLLPLADGSADAAVVSLVLCSVPDQGGALAELHRVLRPGGELRFYEHVRASDPRRARWQRRVDPLWTRLAGGCHLARDTEGAIRAAGFAVEDCDRFLFEPCALSGLTAPHILGRARRH